MLGNRNTPLIIGLLPRTAWKQMGKKNEAQ
jgi:hypothetical protein